jgi:enterochelin esterase family protein
MPGAQVHLIRHGQRHGCSTTIRGEVQMPPQPRQPAPATGTPPAPAATQPAAAAPQQPRFEVYKELMITDLIPWIDSNFRTLTDQQFRAMAGLSMGSRVTREVALPNLDKFSHIGIFSGGAIAPADMSDISKVRLVFMSYGSRENGSANLQEATDVLKKAGINSVSYISPNTAHEWQSWRRSLREFAPLLFND